MRTIIGIAAVAFVGFLAWRIIGRLSDDAIGMGVGMVFGVLAGLPAALLVLVAGRRRGDGDHDGDYAAGQRAAHLDDLRHDARRLLQSQATQEQLYSYMVGDAYTPARPFAAPVDVCRTSLYSSDELAEWERELNAERDAQRRRFRVVGETAIYDGGVG